MTKTGFSLQPQYSLPTEKVMELVAGAGFSAVSPAWTPGLDLEKTVACAAANGMTVQSLHGPVTGIPLLWEPDAPGSGEAQARVLRCVDGCERFQIPVMVLHGWQGIDYTFPEGPLDFRFFDTLVDYAGEKGVSVALENLEGEEYLDALLSRYGDQDHIGFCWDSGHDHCYPHKTDFLERFGPRLIMTHLNDNWGTRDPSGCPSGLDDLHFLPYDGSIPWEDTLRKLAKAPRQEILNFELKLRSHSQDPKDQPYTRLPLEDYLQEAGRRARRIARLYEKMMDNR